MDESYRSPGVEALAGGTLGFGNGGFVAVGEGWGGGSSACRVGDGNGGTEPLLLFEFSFALSFALRFIPPMSSGFSPGDGVAEVFELLFELAFRFVVPPAGIPASDSPVGGVAGSTGWLFGSAARVEPGAIVFGD